MRLTRMTLATASSVLLLSALAGCGGASDDTSEASDRTAAQTQQQGQTPPQGGGGFPGASGLVAAVDGTTAQVQNVQSGQVAVSWTSETVFTQEVDATLDDVIVGAFVMVTNADDDTAASVRIMSEAPGGMPDGERRPEGDGPPGGGDFGTLGEVTEVGADGFTVTSNDDEVTVTVTGDTTYTTTADATAEAVTTGVCMNAQGDTDDTGALTATSISVTKAVDGECGGRMPGPQS
ncbi:hypothetical protein [Nocardioides sp. SR21]|uniref:hypothetical protein n=1 Tax=Nocardioides sp. SR21 TaxID=2919501 RepID=UPI001FAA5DFB|nr:hypothetical protein [Nocardioides sp. SR21]